LRRKVLLLTQRLRRGESSGNLPKAPYLEDCSVFQVREEQLLELVGSSCCPVAGPSESSPDLDEIIGSDQDSKQLRVPTLTAASREKRHLAFHVEHELLLEALDGCSNHLLELPLPAAALLEKIKSQLGMLADGRDQENAVTISEHGSLLLRRSQGT
jgi:hypothetical protein